MEDGGGPALALLEGERERAAHVLEPVLLAQVGAGPPRKPSARAGSGRPSSAARASARSAAAIASAKAEPTERIPASSA